MNHTQLLGAFIAFSGMSWLPFEYNNCRNISAPQILNTVTRHSMLFPIRVPGEVFLLKFGSPNKSRKGCKSSLFLDSPKRENVTCEGPKD